MPVLLLFLFLITPVRLTLTIEDVFTVDVRLWGLGRQWQPKFIPRGEDKGHSQLMRLANACFRRKRARRFFFRHTQLVRMQALVRLGLADAAHTALLTGLLQQLVRTLPPWADLRVQPDFLSSTRIQAKCILFFHLGTIVITAGMLLLARMLEKREHPAAKEA